MEIIPVTPDLSVEMDPSVWRLVQDYDGSRALRTLVHADAQGLRFHEEFVEAHPVLETDLSAEHIARVVVGWTPESQNWRLGLFLDSNGGNLEWCELLTWPASNPANYAGPARAVGEGLSSLIGRQLQMVDAPTPPETHASESELFDYERTQPSASTTPFTPVSLPPLPLPLNVEDWVVRIAPEGIVWQLSPRWSFNRGLRVAFFLLAAATFALLGVGSLRSGLAEVSPAWLPWAAFVIAVLLVYNALENTWKLLTPRIVLFDRVEREVRCQRKLTKLVDWRVPFEAIDYVLISQESSEPQGRRSKADPMRISQDVWVHLRARGEFYQVVHIEKGEGQSWEWELVRRRVPSEERYSLSLREYDTPLHHAVQQSADSLGVRVYVDIR